MSTKIYLPFHEFFIEVDRRDVSDKTVSCFTEFHKGFLFEKLYSLSSPSTYTKNLNISHLNKLIFRVKSRDRQKSITYRKDERVNLNIFLNHTIKTNSDTVESESEKDYNPHFVMK